MTSLGHDMSSATPLDRTKSVSPRSMMDDIGRSLRRAPLWRFLAWREVTQQYDRTVIGAIWIPLNIFIHVALIGFIFSKLFGGERYMPHFALGFAVWTVIARTVSEASTLWSGSEKYLRHMNVPLSVFIFKMISKAGLILMMTLPAGALYAVLTGARPEVSALLIIPGMILLLINLLWIGTIFSVVSLRFRDFAKFTPNLVFLGYMATPVLWEPQLLGDHFWIARLNPLFHLIELIRAPLQGDLPAAESWFVAAGLAVVGNIVAFGVLSSVRKKIVLWL
jgi:lipopolysaccharide transport system permease protein